MLKKTEGTPNAGDAVVIKKYANRRLYNTESSTYVTLEDLATMVRANRDFVVFDAKSGDDLTHAVLTQIIVEQEARSGGQTLLPVPFLRQLIRFYDDALGKMVPGYLQFSLEALARENVTFRNRMANAFGNPASAFEVYQEQARRNLEIFEKAMSMWSTFTPTGQADEKATEGTESAPANKSEAVPSAAKAGMQNTPQSPATPAKPSGSSQEKDDLEALKAELARMSRKIEELSKDKAD